MLAYGRLLHAKQFRNLQLGQPNAFMCIPCLQPDGLVRLVLSLFERLFLFSRHSTLRVLTRTILPYFPRPAEPRKLSKYCLKFVCVLNQFRVIPFRRSTACRGRRDKRGCSRNAQDARCPRWVCRAAARRDASPYRNGRDARCPSSAAKMAAHDRVLRRASAHGKVERPRPTPPRKLKTKS